MKKLAVMGSRTFALWLACLVLGIGAFRQAFNGAPTETESDPEKPE